MAKRNVLVLFGGRSAEHEVSIQSAKNIMAAMDRSKYEILPVAIDRDGSWFYVENLDDPLKLPSSGLSQLGPEVFLSGNRRQLFAIESGQLVEPRIDVAFPVLHGPYGEDGIIQGLLKYCQIPFVGPSVLSSACSMDKVVMKQLFEQHKLPIGKYRAFMNHERNQIEWEQLVKELGTPLFIKPANLGSSVGISKVDSESNLTAALDEAFQYDQKVVIEEYIQGREIEVGILGNEKPEASVPGEILPQHDFYSYQAKYIDEKGAVLKIPAEIDGAQTKEIQDLALQAFRAVSGEGLSRIDFFVTDAGKIYLNEVNTLPGFTRISMYPKLWEASGIKYTTLIDQLINFATQRFEKEKQLRLTVPFYES